MTGSCLRRSGSSGEPLPVPGKLPTLILALLLLGGVLDLQAQEDRSAPTAPASPAAEQEAPSPMTLRDLIEVPGVQDPRISPDGSEVLFVRRDADWEENGTVTHVWLAGTDGSEPVQLTVGEGNESSPRWSPHGGEIAFLADRAGTEGTQVWLLPRHGGEARALTEHPTSVSGISWSPDGRWIYYLADDQETDHGTAPLEEADNVYAFDEDWNHRHLWRVEVETGRAERVTEGDFSVLEYSLSRDGARIVHQRAPTRLLDDTLLSEVWVMDADGGEARQLTENRIREQGARLSPDGSRVLFIANANEDFDFYYNRKLFVMPAGGGAPEVVLQGVDYEINSATWSADGRAVLFRANTGVRQNLYRVDPDTREVTALTRGDHTVGSWHYRPDPGVHAFTVSHPRDAGDVRILEDAVGAEPTRVTRIFESLVRDFDLPRVDTVRYRGEDGVEVEGLLYWPLEFEEGRRYPVVVQTHGGPAASDKFSFFSSSRYEPVLASLGYFVFKPNYRGSTGYGDDFLRDMVPGYFSQAHRDVMAGVDHLVDRGLVDGDRMAKMGWSAGGHMTNKIITHTDRFRAASSGAGAVNWISMYGQSDTRVYRTPWFGGTPWEEDAPIETYWEHSPLMDVSRVTTPTLVLVGENDERVPMAQSVELFRALRSNDVPTHLYVAEEQGHGWRELRQRLFKANVELDWFERWVTGRDYEWERPPGTEEAPDPVAQEG